MLDTRYDLLVTCYNGFCFRYYPKKPLKRYWMDSQNACLDVMKSKNQSKCIDRTHSVRFYHFLSHFEITRKSKSRHRIERSNIENVYEVLFACVNLDLRQKFSFFFWINWNLIVKLNFHTAVFHKVIVRFC